MSTRVFLVRHGETEWNAQQRFQGHADTCLSARGLSQATQVAERLRRETLAGVYSSDLQRAFQTAAAIAAVHGLSVIAEPELREASAGEWEGKSEREVAAIDPEALRSWRADALRNRPPGGETVADLMARVGRVYDRLVAVHAAQTIAVVGHGGSVRAFIAYALGGWVDAYSALRVCNASLSLIEIGRRGPVLALFNDTCHVE